MTNMSSIVYLSMHSTKAPWNLQYIYFYLEDSIIQMVKLCWFFFYILLVLMEKWQFEGRNRNLEFWLVELSNTAFGQGYDSIWYICPYLYSQFLFVFTRGQCSHHFNIYCSVSINVVFSCVCILDVDYWCVNGKS
jgi:hypothetical protein